MDNLFESRNLNQFYIIFAKNKLWYKILLFANGEIAKKLSSLSISIILFSNVLQRTRWLLYIITVIIS